MTQATNFSSIDSLLEELKNNLQNAKLSLLRQEQLLAKVKVASRQPNTAAPLYTRESVSLLATYGLKRGNSTGAKEALRSLANAFFLNVPSRQVFVDLGYGPHVAELLHQCDHEEQFLYARLLFLTTYETSMDFTALARQHGLAKNIVYCLDQHAKSPASLGVSTDQGSMAMSEVLRLMFNIQHFFPDLKRHFLETLTPVTGILLNTAWPNPPLQAPLASVINALLSLDLKSAAEQQKGAVEHTRVVVCLTGIFERAVRQHPDRDLEQGAAPLCTLLRRIYELASNQTRVRMQELILPSEQDREKALGKGDAFSARLLRLSTSSQLPTLRENISNLLFELNDKDPERFVNSVGYGYASGFLMSHNLAVPINEESNHSTEQHDVAVNPITGQRLSAENKEEVPLPDMTEEEKEREAERLFVLFERLKATGVVDVKNPVEEYREKQ